jgi:urea ABC transporter urea binding protein
MPTEPSRLGAPSGSAPPASGQGETLAAGLEQSPQPETTPSYAGLLSAPMGPDELGWLAHYRVLKVLGQGGMGVVFQAEDSHLQRVVALKVIKHEFAGNSVARERFLREARACAALKDDHVVTIYQVGQDRDIPFLAMEFLAGQSLEDRIALGEPLPLPEALRIGREIGAGLASAHGHGLIHRDIKPANIWLEAPSGRVKILDFGLARAGGARSDLTQTGRVVGTPEFMSPEQARGEELDPRSDLFSLGAVLYALCTGQKPFQGTTVMAVLTALAVKTPTPVRSLNPNVPPALADLVDRLLEKDPAKRLASAAEVRDMLAAIAAGSDSPAASSMRAVTTVAPTGATLFIGPPASPARRRPRWLIPAGIVAGIVLLGAIAFGSGWFKPKQEGGAPPAVAAGPPIRIGILHSRTGTMRLTERPVIDAALLAVEEINEQGGVLGRPIEPVVADGQSDEAVFAQAAEKLIAQDKVSVVFGCWTSASRKAVVPVVERHDHVLFYPLQYEGVEQSPNVVYLGPTPNQQILPALRWLVGFEGRRKWFLVGSDYVFPATANAIIRDEAKARGCTIVGEAYLLLGSTEVAGVVKQIAEAKPDLIINSINGDTNVAFFRALRRAGIQAKDVPTLSLSIFEEGLSALGPRDTAGDYVAANYFQSLESPLNRAFLQRFGQRYGPERPLSNPMETAYAAIHLWAKAVQAAGRDDPHAVREAVKGLSYEAPQGTIRIDPATQHAVQTARVAQVDEAGRLMEVYLSPQPIAPEPFPASRSKEEWLRFLGDLHERWGGRWSNPGP